MKGEDDEFLADLRLPLEENKVLSLNSSIGIQTNVVEWQPIFNSLMTLRIRFS